MEYFSFTSSLENLESEQIKYLSGICLDVQRRIDKICEWPVFYRFSFDLKGEDHNHSKLYILELTSGECSLREAHSGDVTHLIKSSQRTGKSFLMAQDVTNRIRNTVFKIVIDKSPSHLNPSDLYFALQNFLVNDIINL